MLGFKKKGGPTRPFSHATDCKILKADPGVEIPWQRLRPAFGWQSANAGRNTIMRRPPMAVSGSTRWTRPPSATRRSDPRIATAIRGALGGARSVVNVGAGAGSYEPDDVRVVAVEPSDVMVRQRLPGSALAVRAVAERLPFADGAFDASLATYTVQHWPDLDRGLSELGRVARKRVVILMSDFQVEESFWLNADYFPTFTQLDRERLMLPGEVLRRVGGRGTITVVPVPWDCHDGFCSAFWRRPDAYLDPRVRAGISYFSIVDEDLIEAGLDRLADDLASGAWDRRFGSLRHLDELDTGQRLIVAEV